MAALVDVHALEDSFTLWCMKRGGVSKPSAPADYEKNIKQIGTFGSVEGFFEIYNFLNSLTETPFNADFHLFRDGIKPVWEDPKNKAGGKLTFRMKRNGLAVLRFWESLLLGFIGETLDPGNGEICGVIASVRNSEVVLSVWTRQAEDQDVVNEIRDRMKSLLHLPGFVKIDYKRHINPSQTATNKH